MQRRFWAIRGTLSIMDTKPPVPRAILVGIQVPSVDDVAHAASIEELGHLARIMHHASRFCLPGWRTHAVDPSPWIGVLNSLCNALGINLPLGGSSGHAAPWLRGRTASGQVRRRGI